MFAAMLTRVRSLLQRRRVAREMDDELRFHVEMEIQSHVDRGVPPVEARRLALRDFGGVVQTKEAIREVRATWFDSMWLDLRSAFRSSSRRPGGALAAVAMLALGIGVTTAMFTVVDALILRPAPFPEPDQLAFVYMGTERGGRTVVSPAVLDAWRESAAFDGAESAFPYTALIEADGAVMTRGIARVTPGLFEMLGGITPLRGRLFDAGDAGAGDGRVLVSEDVWRGLYRADPTLVGSRITVDGESLTVVGILPADFRFPSWDTVLWKAVDLDGRSSSADQQAMAYVRFAAGLPRSDALRLATEAARAADSTTAKLEPLVQPLAGMVLDSYYQRAVPLLAGGVILMFLVLCANVSSLLLARLTARQREFSMRSALGASRRRLMRQALVESALLGALGVVAGAGAGWALVSVARAYLPEAFLLRTLNPLNIDLRALAVTSVTGGVATLGAGLLPAWIGTRADARSSLRVMDRGGTETRGARAATRALLVGEIAFACALLVGATLLVRSFINLAGADRGLEAEGVVVATLSLPRAPFPDRASRAAAARTIEEEVRALPAVQRVAWSYGVPPDGGAFSWGQWTSDAPGAPGVDLTVDRYYVGPEFFPLYGIPLLRGRTFQPSDPPGSVIVSERLARALWVDLDPIGRSFSSGKERFRVIGLAREINHPSLDARLDGPEFYEPFDGVGGYAMMSLRCAAAACPDPAVVRHRIVAAQPAVRVIHVRPLGDVYFEQLARPRAAAALGFAFAAIALLTAAGGLFSVLSYAVGQRRREFGIRTALGASPLQIRRLVLQDGLVVALTGVAFGSLLAWLLARGLGSLQYGVSLADPFSWALVIGLLGLTTAAASWRPAREAVRADPVRLLRED